jgi:DNA-binding GntR family transcriptional regulator
VGETRTATRAAQVHDTLRAAILSGELAPGEPLRLAALAAAYDASMSVVREALGRLAEHNLAVLTPNQGFRVVDVSREDLVAITELRVMLEGEALRHSIEHGDVHWEAAVVSAHHVLERATFTNEDEPGSTQEWSDAHAAFHVALVSACDNPRMLALTNSLRDGAELYRQLSGGSSHFRDRDIAGEHRELMERATARDPGVVDALILHLQRTTDDLLDSGILG